MRSDGTKIEIALRDAGVAVERNDYDGVTHEFFGCAAVLDKAREAQRYAGERLKQRSPAEAARRDTRPALPRPAVAGAE